MSLSGRESALAWPRPVYNIFMCLYSTTSCSGPASTCTLSSCVCPDRSKVQTSTRAQVESHFVVAKAMAQNVKEHNYYGKLRIPGLNIRFEQLVLVLYPAFLIPAVYLWFTHLQKRKAEAIKPAGCRKLGSPSDSRSADAPNTNSGRGAKDQQRGQGKATRIHPIEGCAPIEFDETEDGGDVKVWDEKFVFAEHLPSTTKSSAGPTASDRNWTVRTQHAPGFEKLANVTSEIWVPKASSKDKSNLRRVEQTGVLIVKYPSIPTGPLASLDNLFMKWGMLPHELTFQVPLTPVENHSYPLEKLDAGRGERAWLDLSTHVPDDLRVYIGSKNRLGFFRIDPYAVDS